VDCEIDLEKSIQSQVVNEAEMNEFVVATGQLQGRKEQRDLIAIIRKLEPGKVPTAKKMTMDLNKLRASTIRELIKYAKRYFADHELDYPGSQSNTAPDM
jgi:hypothetical protein